MLMNEVLGKKVAKDFAKISFQEEYIRLNELIKEHKKSNRSSSKALEL